MEKFFVKFLDNGPIWDKTVYGSYVAALNGANKARAAKYEIWQITFGETGKPKSERLFKIQEVNNVPHFNYSWNFYAPWEYSVYYSRYVW